MSVKTVFALIGAVVVACSVWKVVLWAAVPLVKVAAAATAIWLFVDRWII